MHEALNDLPESLVGEIIHGQLIATPRPCLRYAYAASILGALLIPPFHLREDVDRYS